MARWPIAERVAGEQRKPFNLGSVWFEALVLGHSIRAPAVGYRVASDGIAFFCAPDVAAITEPHDALTALQFYLGDVAAITRPILRKKDSADRARIGPPATRLVQDRIRSEAIFTQCDRNRCWRS
jgi:hypothetical protein